MNSSTAERYLYCYRSAGRNPSLVEKAVRFTENDSVLKQMLRDQEAFDARVLTAIQAIQAPEDLKRRLSARAEEAKEAEKKARPQFTVTIVITMICGILSILGLLVYMELDSLAHFPGREAAERMIDTTSGMSGIELEPVTSPAGQLGDWFLLHGLDFYAVPEEFAPLPAVGLRTFRMDEKPIAQVAIDNHSTILYTFRASDFGVDIPKKAEWTVFAHDGWAGAIRQKENTCYLVTFRGEPNEMQNFLRSLRKP